MFSVSSDRITAAAFNPNYRVFIWATADGFLKFFQPWELTRAIGLGCVANHGMTKDDWNFVLVNAQNRLMLFSLNGFLIESAAIEFERYAASHINSSAEIYDEPPHSPSRWVQDDGNG
jgi:hypothetical protein